MARRMGLEARRTDVNLTQEQLAEAVGVSTNTIQRWEAGFCSPLARSRRPLAKALSISLGELDTLLSEHPSESEPTVSHILPVASKKFQVSEREIEQVRTASNHLLQLEHRLGGGGIVTYTAEAQLQWSQSLLSSSCLPDMKVGLFLAVTRLGMRVGAILFDASHYSAASKAFASAATTSEEVGDWQLRAKIYSYRSRLATWVGDPETGQTFAELGLVRSDRITPIERAMLHVARARALAATRQTNETLEAIEAADRAFSIHTNNHPPWMQYYDSAQHHGDTGHALYELARKGLYPASEAIKRLEAAVVGHNEDYVRSRAFSQSKLASLLIATGDVDKAAVVGQKACLDFSSVHSHRAKIYLQELANLAIPYKNKPDIQHLLGLIRNQD